MNPAAPPAPKGPWPSLARRRGAIAAALLFVLAVEALQQTTAGLFLMSLVSSLPLQILVIQAAFVACVVLVLPLLGPGTLRHEFGGQPSAKSMRNGCLLGLLGVAMFWGNWLITTWWQGRHGVWDLLKPLQTTVSADLAALGLVQSLVLTLVGPMVEELMYRGVLWCAVRRVGPPWVAIGITSLAFTLAHGPHRVSEFPCLFAYGLLLGVLRHRSNSLSPTMLAHSLTNVGLNVFVRS